jgi:hypothetical protein
MKEIITIDMIMKEMRTPSNWNDAATMALEFVWDQTEEWFETFTVNMESMREDLDLFIEARFDGDDKIMYAGDAANWSIIALDAIGIASEMGVRFTVESVQETLVRKQRDYGHENIRRFGLQGLLVRTHDKVARLENLLAKGGTPNNESIEDTLLDIVGYSAIGIMWARGDFLLELKPI